MIAIKPKTFGCIKSGQLHHFSDASESGYGVVTSLRMITPNSVVHLAFVTGKERVVTFTRLELAAAVLAVRMEMMISLSISLYFGQTVHTYFDALRSLLDLSPL